MTSTSGRVDRNSAIRSRAAGSSSTITLRNFTAAMLPGPRLGHARREAHHDAESFALHHLDAHLLLRSVEVLETLARVPQPDVLYELPVAQTNTVIGHLQLERVGTGSGL